MKAIIKGGILIILVASLLNCIGEQGAVGPQGVVGSQGAKGDKGDPGASGEFPKTQTGSFTIKVADWKGNTSDYEYSAVIPVAAVTKEVFDKGILSVWWVFSATQQFPLPLDRNSDRILQTFYFNNGEGRVRIDVLPGTNISKPAKPTTDMNFRWVIN